MFYNQQILTQGAPSQVRYPKWIIKGRRNVRSGKGSRLELQEGTVYESGITLPVNPEVINAASI